MNVMYSFNDSYSLLAGVSTTSLFENNKELGEINVYILGSGISEQNKRKFDFIAEQYGRTINFVDAAEIDAYLDNCGIRLIPIYRPTYYKLFLDMVIPDHVENVLCLDGDTLILDSLAELDKYQFEEDKICAMVRAYTIKDYNKYIGVKDDVYYNAGVLLLNMEKWKSLNMMSRIMEAIESGRTHFTALDQDVLINAVTGHIQTLPPKYNVMSAYLDVSADKYIAYNGIDENVFYPPDELEEAIQNPAILHIMRGHLGQPWQKGNRYPYSNKWEEIKLISPWKDIPQVKRKITFVSIVYRMLFKFLPKAMFYRATTAIFKLAVWKNCRQNSYK